MSRNSSPPPKRRSKGSNPADEFVALLKAGARELVDPSDRVVLAVSGGADSMAMLHGWLECRLPQPVVAHFDHRMRAESSEDAAFVAETAKQLDVPFEIGVWNDKPDGAVGEKAARDARYRFLISVARKHDASAIASAHTRDDQAETILFRILRGTGVDGLSGIKRTRDLGNGLMLVRPMLDLPRQLARDFLAASELNWREDASNSDRKRSRNRLRHELLPMLAKEFNPQIVESLLRLSESAKDQASILQNHTSRLWRDLPWSLGSSEASIPMASLRELSAQEFRSILRDLFERQRWPMGRMTADHWKRMSIVKDEVDGATWQGPDGMTAERTATSFVVRRRSLPGEP